MNKTVTEKERVIRNTPESINRMIKCASDESVAYFALHPSEIPRRLKELEEEWDIERALEVNAASFSLAGIFLGLKYNRKWMLLPLAVAAFLLQHGIQGWCPPLPFLRRLGIRTKEEIFREKIALRILNGDFSAGLEPSLTIEERIKKALEASE